tara:strand:- start:7173 stop:7295 length:123 start_codon:yes stop_codon:yes gene_type:complete
MQKRRFAVPYATFSTLKYPIPHKADVAELADAPDSKSGSR